MGSYIVELSFRPFPLGNIMPNSSKSKNFFFLVQFRENRKFEKGYGTVRPDKFIGKALRRFAGLINLTEYFVHFAGLVFFNEGSIVYSD